jgi:uncharacterized protein with WD repeat
LQPPDVKIYWHPQGDYLAVKVDRYTKTKKSTYTGFELFRCALLQYLPLQTAPVTVSAPGTW